MSLRPEPADAPFFVGYLPAPKVIVRWVVTFLAPVLACAALGVTIGLSLAQPDPGDPGRAGRAEMTGLLTVDPYPVLYVAPDDEYPLGRSVLLVGQGKNGFAGQSADFVDSMVTVTGGLLQRSGATMIEAAWRDPIVSAELDQIAAPARIDLGTMTLRGEVMDSKCFAGAMRPGEGRTHRACANLCLLGGIPPVFVTRQADGGEQVFMLTGPDGEDITDAVLPFVAVNVALTGTVEQRGDLMVFQIDPATIEVL